MEKTHSQLLIATLHKCYAEKEASLAIVESLIKEGAGKKGENIDLLKLEFEKIAKVELTMTVIQTYFANNQSITENQNTNLKNNDNDDNNS